MSHIGAPPDLVAFSNAGVRGGFRAVEVPPPRGGTLVVLYSPNQHNAERAVIAVGGEIVGRHTFPGGRRFHFLDPSGNELGVWTRV